MTAPDRAAVEAAVAQLRAAAKTREGTGLEGLDAPVLIVLDELERLGRERNQDTRAVLDIVNGIERNLGVDPADELRNHFGNRDWRLRPKAADLAARDERDEDDDDPGDPCAVCYCPGCPQCVNPTPPSEVCFCMKAMRTKSAKAASR